MVLCYKVAVRILKQESLNLGILKVSWVLILTLNAVFPIVRMVYKTESQSLIFYAFACFLLAVLMIRRVTVEGGGLSPSTVRFLRSGRVHVLAVTVSMAVSAAAVAAHWDQSGWTDSRVYDAIAHSIATGENLAGSSYYMPVYQYGLGLLYYIFGHFYFVPQIVNVLMAGATVVFIVKACKRLFEDQLLVTLIALWAALAPQLHYAAHQTQIENWYTPIVALVIWAWAECWTRRSFTSMVWFALALVLALNTRTQGAFFIGWLILTPLFFVSSNHWHNVYPVSWLS